MISIVKEEIKRGSPDMIDVGKIRSLTVQCDNRDFLERAAEELVDDVAQLATTMHRIGKLDAACLGLLAKFVTTKVGFEYFLDHRDIVRRWDSYVHSRYYSGFNSWNRACAPFLSEFHDLLKEHCDESSRKKCPNSFDKERCPQLVEARSVASASTEVFNEGQFRIITDSYVPAHMMRRRVGALPRLYKEITRDQFASIFPKGCFNCLGLNLVCAAELLDDSEFLCSVVNQILNDPPGEIFTVSEMDHCRRLSRQFYDRRDEHYPHMGCCLDFGLKKGGNPLLKSLDKLGRLICSEKFSLKMLTHRSECIDFVKMFFTDSAALTVDAFCDTLGD